VVEAEAAEEVAGADMVAPQVEVITAEVVPGMVIGPLIEAPRGLKVVEEDMTTSEHASKLISIQIILFL